MKFILIDSPGNGQVEFELGTTDFTFSCRSTCQSCESVKNTAS